MKERTYQKVCSFKKILLCVQNNLNYYWLLRLCIQWRMFNTTDEACCQGLSGALNLPFVKHDETLKNHSIYEHKKGLEKCLHSFSTGLKLSIWMTRILIAGLFSRCRTKIQVHVVCLCLHHSMPRDIKAFLCCHGNLLPFTFPTVTCIFALVHLCEAEYWSVHHQNLTTCMMNYTFSYFLFLFFSFLITLVT